MIPSSNLPRCLQASRHLLLRLQQKKIHPRGSAKLSFKRCRALERLIHALHARHVPFGDVAVE